MNTIIFFLITSAQAAENTAIYELRGLAPVGFTHSETAAAARYYFEFENEQGKHVFVYEEGANERPPRMLGTLRQAASGSGMLCAADVECSEKAQCASDCHEMYYALAASATSSPHGHCRIKLLSCEQRRSPAADVKKAPVPASKDGATPHGS